MGDRVRVGVLGADGALGRRVESALAGRDVEVVRLGRADDLGSTPDVVAVAAPWQAARDVRPGAAVVGAALVAEPADGTSRRDGEGATIAGAGWFGGVGTLLAGRAAAVAGDPVEVHVAYAVLPGPVRAWPSLSPGLRIGIAEVLSGAPGRARIDGRLVDEPVAEGRRLAWFPRPVGPWHTVAVPGVEVAALAAPTVRTWLGFGSLGAELLQALAHGGPERWVGRRLGRDGGGGGTDPTGLRWAVVAEVRTRAGEVHRGWANGTDPVRAAAELVAAAAVRADASPGARTVLDLAPPAVLLDELADRGVLRWSVARPTAGD